MAMYGYARVSTEDQAYSQALQQQVYRLKTAGAEKIYADVASRTKDDRQGLLEIVSQAREGDTVLVTRLDRVTSSPGLFESISKKFQENRILLLALDENVDIHSVDGEFAAGLQIYFSKREVGTIRLRVRKAKEVSREKGRASSTAPWGYKPVNGKYQLDHAPFLCLLSNQQEMTKADLGRDIIALFFETGSTSACVKILHQKYGIQKFKQVVETKKSFYLFEQDDPIVIERPKNTKTGRDRFSWSRDGIRVYLTNPVLRGHTPYLIHKTSKEGKRSRAPQDKWDIRYDTHKEEKLVSDDQWHQIQQILETNRKLGGWGSHSNTYPLTGLLVCGKCGRGMKCQGSQRARGRKNIYYQCKNYVERSCDAKTMIPESLAEQVVIEALTRRAEAIVNEIDSLREIVEPPELKELRVQLAGLERLGFNQIIEEAKQKVRRQIENLTYQLQESAVIESNNRELLLEVIGTIDFWQKLGADQKRRCYQTLVKKAVVRDGKVEQVILKV